VNDFSKIGRRLFPRKLHDVDLRLGEELLGPGVEEHQADVLRMAGFQRAARDEHPTAQRLELHCFDFLGQRALNLLQVGHDEVAPQVAQRSALVEAVVKGHRVRERQQIVEVTAFGLDGAGVVADVVAVVAAVFSQANRRFVGPRLSAWRTDQQNSPLLDAARLAEWVVHWLDSVPQRQQLLLNFVQRIDRKANGRQQGTPILFRHSDNDVAAAQVVEVVGEGAHGVQHFERIPARLEFEALPLHGGSAQNLFDIYQQAHAVIFRHRPEAPASTCSLYKP
jgi:hypothetical protein